MTKATSICFTYPRLPPREFSRNSREHWSVLNRVKDQVVSDIAGLLLETGWKPGIPWTKGHVTVEFVLPDRKRRDHDNLVTSMKPLYDALVTNGVLKDDDLDCIGVPIYTWRYEKGVSATEITVAERRE